MLDRPLHRQVAQMRTGAGQGAVYNNYNDADAALELVAEFPRWPATVVIVACDSRAAWRAGATVVDISRRA
jgi:AICAR transformylase/IMP cyclohydrolase PurH